MRISRTALLWSFAAVAVLMLSGVVVAVLKARTANKGKGGLPDPQERADEREASGGEPSVKVIRPRHDPALMMSVEQLVTVEPFFEADLRAQVAGVVRSVHKDIGDRVSKGELLLSIDVPDLRQQLWEKETMVAQRRKDVAVAKRLAEVAEAQVEVAHQVVELRTAEVGGAEATRDYRKNRYARFQKLAGKGGVLEGVVEEEERDFQAAEFAVRAAVAAVHKADADLREKESSVHAAEADVELKEAMVEVAEKDLAKERELYEYSRIRAPFDGEVIRRKVDPGTFVQNASSGQSEPLLGIARTDVVTLVAYIPDNAAPYVTRGTQAIIHIDDLPGVVITGKVTRFARSIRNRDRTMRVEVDLYNDTPEQYGRFRAKCVGTWLGGMAGTNPLGVATLMGSARTVWSADSKSRTDRFPIMPVVEGKETAAQLIPGMSGYMRLNLKQFRNAYLIPSSAVFTRGGKPYVMEVRKDQTTHLLPVRVHLNDGRLANVSIILQEADPTKGQPERLEKLTGRERLILNRQSELNEGQPVKATPEESWEKKGVQPDKP